jgi:2-oxoglutarate dehydrogenase complex, dehydrogenase (E1) component, and related enzymes
VKEKFSGRVEELLLENPATWKKNTIMEPGEVKRNVDNKFFYTKKRSEFGRPYEFECDDGKVLMSIEPDPSLLENFIAEDPVDQGVQYSKQFALHEVSIHKKPTPRFRCRGKQP